MSKEVELRLRFFSWNPIASFGGDLEFHATVEEAQASAESALEDALDGDFDSDAEGICWGEVRGFAEFEKVHEHGRGTPCWDEAYDDGEQECSAGVSLEWDYALSGKIVEVDNTEQKKLEARVAELERELAALQAQVCLTHKLVLEEGELCWKCRNSEILSALNALRASGTIARYDYLEVEGREVWVWRIEEGTEPFAEVMAKLGFELEGGYRRELGADQFFISEWVEIEKKVLVSE